ncbi:hypothetical protein CRENBAI_026207 [Crenichthys baileyi]|uniref:Uncharacterized protein n=1 Tax=Crenichthys baileyi TaxID=28760 RepID=A0AAV9QVF0_9TELE
MRSNSIPAPVLTTRVLRHHSSPLPPFVRFLFSSSAANLLPFTSLLLQDKSLLVGMKRDGHCSLNKGASFSKLQPGVAEFGLILLLLKNQESHNNKQTCCRSSTEQTWQSGAAANNAHKGPNDGNGKTGKPNEECLKASPIPSGRHRKGDTGRGKPSAPRYHGCPPFLPPKIYIHPAPRFQSQGSLLGFLLYS